MANQPKYVSLEPDAFLSDEDFQIMTAEERGAYWTIILYLYRNNGRLKYEENKLRKLCNVNGEFSFQSVLRKFKVQRGYIRHKRVTKELRRAQNLVDRGVKGANARWLKQCSSNAQASAKQCQVSKVSKVSKRKNIKKENSLICFDNFWEEYPRKEAKGRAKEWFGKNNPTEEDVQKMLYTIRKQSPKGGRLYWGITHREFVPLPTTWLNDGDWRDAPTEVEIKQQVEENVANEQRILEKKRQDVRADYSPFYQSKSKEELVEMRKNNLLFTHWWLIDEIMGNLKG